MNKPPEMSSLGTPHEVADYLHTSVGQLAQFRYLGKGPKFVKVGRNTLQRTDDPRD